MWTLFTTSPALKALKSMIHSIPVNFIFLHSYIRNIEPHYSFLMNYSQRATAPQAIPLPYRTGQSAANLPWKLSLRVQDAILDTQALSPLAVSETKTRWTAPWNRALIIQVCCFFAKQPKNGPFATSPFLAQKYVLLKPDHRWTSQASSVYEYGSYGPMKAFDRDVRTFYHSNGTGAYHWLELNIGRVVSVKSQKTEEHLTYF